MVTFDVITMGRIGVDVYRQQIGVSLREVTSFGKFLGGSSTNVAYGRRVATITRTGAVAGLPTPVTFCETFPPDDFPLDFYREPKAPDLEIHADELDLDAIRAAQVELAG